MNRPPHRIVLIESDPATAAPLLNIVSDVSYSCRRFASGQSALRELSDGDIDLLIVGRTVPDTETSDVLTGIRARFGYGLPVIALVSPDYPQDFARALDNGADDCLIRPVTPAILLAQIRAALRRGPAPGPRVEASIGHLRLEPDGLRAYLDDEMVELTAKEYALALLLCRNLGAPLGRENILATIWGEDIAPSTRTLDVHVSRLRTKLDLRQERGFRLAALYGRGYRLDFTRLAPVPEMAIPARIIQPQPASLSARP